MSLDKKTLSDPSPRLFSAINVVPFRPFHWRFSRRRRCVATCTNFGLQLGTRPPSCHLMNVESQPHSCDLTMLDDTPNDTPSLQRIASTMDLLAILHSHKIAHNITSIAFLKRKKKRNKRFNHLSESFVVSRVLYREYRFSAYEIYLRRSFAPGSLLNEVSKRTG